MIVVHNLTRWIWEKKFSAHVAYSMKKGKIPKNDLMWPSNFEGDGLHLNFLKKPKFLGLAHLSST